MKCSAPLILMLLILTAVAPVAKAQDLFSVGIGQMGILDGDDYEWDVRMEYRWGNPLIWQIKPFAGLEINDDGAAYGAGGLYYDFGVASHWYLTPSFGVGLWHNGGGPDLGNVIEFRSQMELGYEFQNQHRLSLGLSHISNAVFGDQNPGTEVLNAYWHMPVGWWSRQ